MYVEDVELCWRLAGQGRPTVLAADIDVAHVGNAAGAQAWGATRERRWWAATYDVVDARRGTAYARALALVNVLGVTTHLAVAGVGSYLDRARRDHRRGIARRCADILPIHWTALTKGTAALATEAGVQPPA
jgi:GT2 family glycosyltransferase